MGSETAVLIGLKRSLTVAASMSGFLLSRGNFDSPEVFVFVFLAVSLLFIIEYPFGKDVPI